ncbi:MULTISPECIES: alpha-L-fucosidase [Thermoanaerobacterium]|uniref:alpha-L-fucosidase n=2 Tax=Thermoanaerobacterium TaxID=28895 RepID=W9E942_9THEO|nr:MULTISPECIES: alpha-L-fucosidase [Thermoanaerobacterium]AFK86286.1 glycoside hydrolase family 29 (alpha-L-fucosidase) [Thermoanaerobacterium saccharolyticum JW/SL-YS485]ETO37370.1 glycoside hydrolase family protein [Thermoanaerobacterium aotearoense SCUT27]
MIPKKAKSINWFTNARFGMFIHWGLYAIPARGEWVRSQERISNEDYEIYFREFNPTNYDPKKWAQLAKYAGMKYAVMTAKHHDGFCLFDSKLTDYKSTNTPVKKDLIKDYLDAFRKENLRVGLYYSLLDWHHDEYPAYNDPYHPMRGNELFRNKEYDFSKYVDYMHSQVRELTTNYGKLDIMWFDFSYDDKTGDAWGASELVKMVRSNQPEILINSRLGGNLKSIDPEVYAGDFATPEQMIPAEGVFDELGNPVPWEACITMNDHWGYCAIDKDFKSAKQIIRLLVECVSKDGNLLLNVGPNAKGEIPEESVEVLLQIGKWMNKNSDSIYDCGSSELPKPEWGRYTKNGKKLYAHIFERSLGPIVLKGLKGKINKARLLSDLSEIKVTDYWHNNLDDQDSAFLDVQWAGLPDEIDTVIELELK